MKTEILGTDTPELFRAAVRRAVDSLRAGGVVALPTETVYGLAANALDADAVAEIFRVKGRPAHNPIIVHVASIDMARSCTSGWPEVAEKLAGAFWPGPLTMVLQRASRIPDIVTAGGPTVGVRWPSHPFIQAVIRECGFPLAAPSANISNRVSPTTALHVQGQLGDKVRLIVDGGASQVGIESAVVDLTASPPRVLRPGMIHTAALEAALGNVTVSARQAPRASALRSPGLLQKHYAPKAKLVVWKWKDENELRGEISNSKFQISNCAVISHSRTPSPRGFGRVSVIPHDPEAFARALYAELHRCDEIGVGLIVVEAPPDVPEWIAVADRLRKAAG